MQRWAQIVKANGYCARKGFEYFEVSTVVGLRSTLPSLDLLSAICSKLFEDLERPCLER
jgi:hypothetical protein